MSIEVTYTITCEITGEKQSEMLAGGKGAGEGKTALEKMIEQAKFSASNTSIEVTDLTQTSP